MWFMPFDMINCFVMQVSDGNLLSRQDSKGRLDLGLCLSGHNDNNDPKDESEDGALEKIMEKSI